MDKLRKVVLIGADPDDGSLSPQVWLPMYYGMVPVVYGGVNYSQLLPPNSYIDATQLTPLALATLLKR